MEAMVNNMIKALGWSIFHSLWQGAIIYAILFVILAALPKLNAKLKHNLAFGSLLLIFISFCFTFFSVFEVPLNQSANYMTLPTAYQDLNFTSPDNFLKAEAFFPFISSLYIIGITIQLLVLLTGYHKLKQLKKADTMEIPAPWKAVFEDTLAKLKIYKSVSFFISAKVNVPLVVGYFKPVVLFPIALANQLDLKQVEAILIHELSHIRRNDYILNLIKTFLETVLFFNPFIWLASRFIQIEREHACDDLVVKYTGTPVTYAHALLKLELLKDKQAPALSLAASGANQHLYQRIKRITNMKTSYMNAKQQLFILGLMVSTVFSIAWMNPSKPATIVKKSTSLVKVKSDSQESKPINNHLIVKVDTDSTKAKTKRKYQITITDDRGDVKTYTSLNDVPDSLRKTIIRHQFIGDSISAIYNSKEWKDKMAKIREDARVMSEKYNSKEWKDQMAKVREDARAMTEKYNSKEWKDQMAKVQENARAMAEKYNSKEWKDQMAKVQENARAMAEKYNSKEWKDQMAKVREDARAMAEKYNSKEWKDQMAKVRENALAMSEKYNSKEWKDQMVKIQENAKEIQKKVNSPEWKARIEEMKKLQNSPEYQELKKKFDKDLNELKKKKGIKEDNTSVFFNF